MLRLVVCGLILGTILRESVCQRRCPDSSWSSYNGHCYLVISGYPENPKSWYDAEDYCRENNATLASIHSSEEEGYLLQQLKSWRITDYVWIGLHQLTNPGRFNWSDGTTVDFEIWEIPRKSNKCVMMRKTNGEWRDQNCGYLQGFVCKRKEGDTVPRPPAVSIYRPTGNCPAGWHQYGVPPKCYKFFDGPVTRDEAKTSCESLGENHYLVSIHNTNEQMFLTSLLGYQRNDTWIGLESSYTSRLEMWSDNSRYDYSNWMPGDGSYYWVRKCPKMRASSKTAGRWEGSMCDVKIGYICQREPDTDIPNPPKVTSTCGKDGYMNYRDACYRVVRERETWNNAQENCKEDGGNLASITDAFENAFLYSILQGLNDRVWIGLSDKQGSGFYEWVDRWPKVFLQWESREPKTLNIPSCVSTNNHTRKWVNDSCEERYPYVCKMTKEKPPVFPIKQHRGECPFPSNSSLDFGGEYCYHLGHTRSRMWSSALMYCMQKGSTLASFHSVYETELLWPLIGSDLGSIWIGLYQREDGVFIWQNGDVVDYTNWAPGRQEGGCVSFDSKDMLWVRSSCNDAYEFATPLCMAKKT